LVVPERDGIAYILNEKSVSGSKSHLRPRAQRPLPYGLGLMRTRHKSPDMIREKSRATKQMKW
jgi:hypothetical protein